MAKVIVYKVQFFVALSILIPTAVFAENTIPFPDYPDPTNECRHMAAVGEQLTPEVPGRTSMLTPALRKHSATILSRRRFGRG